MNTFSWPFSVGNFFSKVALKYSKINFPDPPPICVGVGSTVEVGFGVFVAVGAGVMVCVGVDVEIAVARGEQDDSKKTKSKNRFIRFIIFSFLLQVSNFQSFCIFQSEFGMTD